MTSRRGGRLSRREPGSSGWRLRPGTALVLAGAGLAAFALLSYAVSRLWLVGLDALITGWAVRWHSPGLTPFMQAATYLGSAAVLVPLGLLTAAWVWGTPPRRTPAADRRGARLGALVLVVALAGSSLLNTLLKYLFQRVRPDVFALARATGYAYPSGHSMSAMAFYAVASYIVAPTLLRGRRLAVEERRGPARRRRWYPAGLAISAAAIVLLVGVTRVYLGVHYPSDVVGGFLAGGAWALFCLAWFERLRHGL